MKRLFKLALFIGGVAMAARFVAAQKAAWTGLTESELRQKLDSRFGSMMPADKQVAMADKVVAKMRDRGALRDG
jgi:hypothetical protein